MPLFRQTHQDFLQLRSYSGQGANNNMNTVSSLNLKEAKKDMFFNYVASGQGANNNMNTVNSLNMKEAKKDILCQVHSRRRSASMSHCTATRRLFIIFQRSWESEIKFKLGKYLAKINRKRKTGEMSNQVLS